MDERRLIWSHKHGGAWWREEGAGYTCDIMSAGLFDPEEAAAQERRSDYECVAVDPALAFGIVATERARVKDRNLTDQNNADVWYRRYLRRVAHPAWNTAPEPEEASNG